MTTLEDLIDALGKATGPDRWLDANIYVMAHEQTIEIFGGNIVSNGRCVIGYIDPGKESINFTPSGIGERIPYYTAWTDAAISLVRRVLPRFDYGLSDLGEDGSEGRVWKHGYHNDTVVLAYATTPALALVLATLRSLHQEKNNAE